MLGVPPGPLPLQVMVANIRCAEIAAEQLEAFRGDAAWQALAEEAGQDLAASFGQRAADLMDSCLEGEQGAGGRAGGERGGPKNPGREQRQAGGLLLWWPRRPGRLSTCSNLAPVPNPAHPSTPAHPALAGWQGTTRRRATLRRG